MSQTMKHIMESFGAFNRNGLNSILYIMQTNMWFVLIAVAAVASVVLQLKDEITYSVHEEQQIL